MKKELKDYLHLYLGCQVWDEYDDNIKTLFAVSIDNVVIKKATIHTREFKEVKLILRSLFDMGNKEQAFFGCPDDYFDYMKKMEHQIIHLHSDEFIYLLSKHFDLFGLIESGLAIDAKTLQPTTIK